MALKECIMLDEDIESKEEEGKKKIAIVLSDKCIVYKNIMTIPVDEALSIAANIDIQVAMLL